MHRFMDIEPGTNTAIIRQTTSMNILIAAYSHAGAVKSAQASVYTKGEISLAMTGSDSGVNIGIDSAKLEISKRTK